MSQRQPAIDALRRLGLSPLKSRTYVSVVLEALDAPTPNGPAGAPVTWIAYYSDWSEFALFDSEIKALRYAVEHSMDVVKVEFGHGVREQERAQFAARMVQEAERGQQS